MPRRPPRRGGSSGFGEGRHGSASDDDIEDHLMGDGAPDPSVAVPPYPLVPPPPYGVPPYGVPPYPLVAPPPYGVPPHPLVTPTSYAVPPALGGQHQAQGAWGQMQSQGPWSQQQPQVPWAQQEPQVPFAPITQGFFHGVVPGVSAPFGGSQQDLGRAPATGSNFGDMIHQAGLAARPALNEGVQYPYGPPPMTLHNQFQLPAGRSTGSSRQGDEPHVSPPSVQRGARSSTSPSGPESDRGTRGQARPKTREMSNPSERVSIKLINKKTIQVLSDHELVKKHSDVISDIGAIIAWKFPGAWYKIPHKDQHVTEASQHDGGYVWPSYLRYWQETLRYRYSWPRNQDRAMEERFALVFRERLSRMIYAGRYRPNKNGHPVWATPRQWAEILRRIANDPPYLATCEQNRRNRTAQGSYSTHGSGRTPHLERIDEAVVKNDGKALTFTERFCLTHGKKGAKYDPALRGLEAPIVEILKPRYSKYWAAGVQMFGVDETTWPDDWEDRIIAAVPDPGYKGNVPGFAHLTPAEVRAPRRRGRNAGINIGEPQAPPPQPDVSGTSNVRKWMEKQTALSKLVTKLLGKAAAAPDPEMEEMVKLNEEMQAECEILKAQEALRVAEERRRWEEDERVRAFYRGEGPSSYGGGSPVRDDRPAVESPPSMFEPTHISGTPQDSRYMEQLEEEEEESIDSDESMDAAL